jgi:GGDEF domain-containing protein
MDITEETGAQRFGGVLKRVCGEEAVFRFGGDEFCILFKGPKIQEVVRYCEAVQSNLLIFPHLSPEAARPPVLESLGTKVYVATRSEKLGQRLYKRQGRKDTIRIFEDIG